MVVIRRKDFLRPKKLSIPSRMLQRRKDWKDPLTGKLSIPSRMLLRTGSQVSKDKVRLSFNSFQDASSHEAEGQERSPCRLSIPSRMLLEIAPPTAYNVQLSIPSRMLHISLDFIKQEEKEKIFQFLLGCFIWHCFRSNKKEKHLSIPSRMLRSRYC